MKPYYGPYKGITIYHGDCREVLPTLSEIDLILTDPPYGCDVQYGDNYSDDRSTYWDWFIPWVRDTVSTYPTVIFTHRNAALGRLPLADWIGTWLKDAPVDGARIGNSCIVGNSWEPIFMYGIHRYGTSSNGFSDRFECRANIGEAKRSGIGRAKTKSDWHPCPKPISLFVKLLMAFSQGKHLTCDPFAGSGITLQAAKQLGLSAIGIEIEERYCEIAARRLSQEVIDFD